MATLEELVIELKLDSAELKRGLSKVQADLDKTGKVADGLSSTFKRVGGVLAGAFAVHKIAGDFKQAINYMDEMADAADRVGISSEAFSKLAYAAKITEVPLGTLEMALRKMQLALVEASGSDSSKAAQALSLIGLEANKLRSLGADEALAKIADGLNKITDPAQKAAAAQAIFGRNSRMLNDLLKEGGDAIRGYGEEARKFGVVIDKEAAAKAEEFKKTLVRLESQWQGMVIELSKEGVLDAAIEALAALGRGVTNLATNLDYLSKKWRQFTGDLSDNNLNDLEFKLDEIDRKREQLANRPEVSKRIDALGSKYLGLGTPEEELAKQQADLSSKFSKLKRQKELDEFLKKYSTPPAPPPLQKKTNNVVSLNNYKNGGTVSSSAPESVKEVAAVKQQAEEVKEITDSLENDIRQIGNTITSGIGNELVDAMKRGESAGKAMWDSFRYRALNAIGDIAGKMIERQLFGGGKSVSGGGSGFGDFLVDAGKSLYKALPSFDTGGYTGASIGAGMDGKGGFPAMLHPNELVLNKNQQKGLSGGGSNFTQNVNIIATSQSEIDRRIQMQAPMIARLASDLVQGQMGRGGSMSKEVGRRL